MEEKKTKKYEVPKAVDLEGQELTDNDLEGVAGGMAPAEGDCTGGGCCGGGANSATAELR